MAIGSFPTELRSYIPSTMLQPDGATLKPGIDRAQAEALAKSVQAQAGALPPAEARLFLAMVSGADLAPNGKIPADVGKTLAAFQSAAASLSRSSGNTFDFLARVMIEQASDQRKNALDNRLSAREQAKSELMGQAEKMQKAAEESSSAALNAMITTVVMSSVAFVASSAGAVLGGMSAVKQGAGFKDALGGAKAAGLQDAGTKAAGIQNAATKPISIKDAATQAQLGMSSGMIKAGKAADGLGGAQTLGQIGQSAGGYQSAMGEAASKTLDAEGQREAAKAQDSQARADVAKESQEALNQMMQSIIQFLKDLQEAKAEQMRTLTRV